MTNEDIQNKLTNMKVYTYMTGQKVIIKLDNGASEEEFIELIQSLIDKIYMLNPNFNYDLRPHIYLKVNVDETESEIQQSTDWEKYYNIHYNQKQLSLSNSQMHDEIKELKKEIQTIQKTLQRQEGENKRRIWNGE